MAASHQHRLPITARSCLKQYESQNKGPGPNQSTAAPPRWATINCLRCGDPETNQGSRGRIRQQGDKVNQAGLACFL